MNLPLEQIKAVFGEAAGLPPHERPAFLARRCGGNAALRARVEALLTARDEIGDYLSHPTINGGANGAPADHRAGETIGPYRLLERIGEGGFGVVFMAEQHAPVRRLVALKIIKLGMDTRHVIARFEAERQALAMMDHPNIAKVLDAGATGTGRPYFVMELVKGEPITRYCDASKLTPPERLRLFIPVCHAAQHAHQKGIIHRDIKPSNVLVTLHDGAPSPKIIDFGIAKATFGPLTEKTLFTGLREMLGTPEYMSPEQAEMSGLDIDTRTDIYSLGVLLYELLTGATPFDSAQLRAAAYAELQRVIREVEPPKPSTRLLTLGQTLPSVAALRRTEPGRLSAMLRGDLDWIVMKALEKDRTRRYETANGLAADVLRHLRGEAVIAAPPSGAYKARKFIKRHKGTTVAAGVITGALLAGMGGTLWQAGNAAEQRELAKEEAKRANDRASAEQQRAMELKRVSDFQERMLDQIDPIHAGVLLRQDLITRFESALGQSDLPEAARAAEIELFRRQLSRVNATDAATSLIDATILKPAAAAIDEQFKDQPVVDAQLRQALADRYEQMGLYAEAAVPQSISLSRRRNTLGNEHADTLESVSRTGNLLLKRGEFEQAEAFFREALDGRVRALGREDPKTISSARALSVVLLERGKFDEAERLLREALDQSRVVLGDEHANTISAINNMGALLMARGKPDEAEPYCREALETSRRVRGNEHPETLACLSMMGGLLMARGKHEQALGYYRESLETRQRVLGEEHPRTLASINNVGYALQAMGKPAEAESHYREAMGKHRRVLGDEHPDTLTCINNVGAVLRERGAPAEAEACHREVLAVRRRVLGSEHKDTLNSINNLAVALLDQRHLAEAEPLYLEALATRRRVLGEDHADTLTSVNNMAGLLRDQGKLDEAEPYLREAVEKSRRVLGPEHSKTLTFMYNYGRMLQAQGKLDEAEPYHREALEARRRVLGPEHPDTVWSLLNLGILLHDQGELAEAEPYIRSAVEIRQRTLAPAHPDTLTSIGQLANLLVADRRHSDAIALLDPILPDARSVLIHTHAPRLGVVLRTLGIARAGLGFDAGRFAEAEANLLEAHTILAKARGGEHKETRACARAIADLYSVWHAAAPTAGWDAKAVGWMKAAEPAR